MLFRLIRYIIDFFKPECPCCISGTLEFKQMIHHDTGEIPMYECNHCKSIVT